MMTSEFWVATCFVTSIVLAFWFGAHTKVGAMLDTKGERVRDDLAEAERMRSEAAELLASFEKKRAAAEKDAAAIVEEARIEAEQIAKDAAQKMDEFVKRRSVQADAKIANAEVQALAQVHAITADAAAAAAEIVLRNHDKASFSDGLIKQGIEDVRRLAN